MMINNSYSDNEVPLLIMMGQSNTDGRGIQKDVADLSNYQFEGQVKIFQKPIQRNPSSQAVNHINNGYWEDYTGRNGMIVSPQSNSVATSCGPELGTAYLWATNIYPVTNKPLYIIKCAIGGAPLANNTTGIDTNWSTAPGQIWDLATLHIIRPAITQLLCQGKIPRLIGVFWGQGESDATAKVSALYERNLTLLIQNIREKLGFSNARMIIMGLSDYNQPAEPWQHVKNAQITVSNQDKNSVLIKTDGSDNFTPANRYLPNVQATDLHYTAIGHANIAEKAFQHYSILGDYYDQHVNDFELIANASPGYASLNLNKLSTILVNNGSVFQKLTANSSAGIIPTYSWVADPSAPYVHSVGYPCFLLNNFDNVQDQEIIFRMAHDGDEGTKPGVLLRGSYGAAYLPVADFLTGILVQVRKGGKQLTVFLRKNSEWIAQIDSPITTPSTIEKNNLVWYRVRVVAKTLTVDIYYNDKLRGDSAPPLDSDWENIYKQSNNEFPDAGQTWFTLYNGSVSTSGPYSAHFHMPVLIANKLRS